MYSRRRPRAHVAHCRAFPRHEPKNVHELPRDAPPRLITSKTGMWNLQIVADPRYVRGTIFDEIVWITLNNAWKTSP